MKRPALLTQVLAVNALLIAATVLAATVTVHLDPDAVADRRRLGLLVVAVLATVLVNGLVLRRRFAPLEQLIAAMESVDFSARRAAVPVPAGEVQEVARLRQAYHRMLERLEIERTRTASAVLQAQESERARVARDLHDEANQALTGVFLRLQATAEHAPPDLRAELRETQGVATQAMEELLRPARELRPAALDDLGLAPALRTLVAEFGRRAGVDAAFSVDPGALDGLDEDGQLVVYRVEVVAEAADGAAAVAETLAHRPDLAILDVAMPRLTGLQATRKIKAQAPDVDVLILSMHDDERYLFEALKAGASGYVLKQKADQDLLDAVRAVGRGEPFLTNSAMGSLVREWMADPASGPREPLSPREQQVLKLIAEAHTNRDIAALLELSEKTVEAHRASILRKLGMRDRVELVRYAIRRGLVEP